MNFHYLIALLNKRCVFVTGGLIRWIYKREETINYDTFVNYWNSKICDQSLKRFVLFFFYYFCKPLRKCSGLVGTVLDL